MSTMPDKLRRVVAEVSGTRIKRPWLDPNKEGKSRGRLGKRYCARCGNTVQTARILKAYNLCEFCVKDLEKKKDGVWTCKSCGRLAPAEVRAYNGYCLACVCRICRQPDREYVSKTGLCRRCATQIGDFCLACGKEAPAQTRKNKGLCDQCLQRQEKPGYRRARVRE